MKHGEQTNMIDDDNDPDPEFDDEGDPVFEMECPYCEDGWQQCDGIKVPCAECGGTGWY